MNQLTIVAQRAWEPALLALLGVAAVLGAVAVISPPLFQRLAQVGGRWFDASKALEVLDRRIDIDAYILPRSRLLGFAVLASVAVLWFTCFYR